MMKLIIRADDFGFSEAVNYGVMKAYRGGLVKNIGLMSNMPYAEHAFHLIKDEDVALGLHVNLILGTPCARTEQIPSLVDKQGQLLSSRLRRNEMRKGIDGFVYEDTLREVEAQIERFISLCGKLPDYIDAHAVCTPTSEKAISDAADAYGIHIQGHKEDPRWEGIQKDFTNEDFYKQKLPFVEFFKSYLQYSSDRISLIVFHPGFVDYDVLCKSSLQINRCLDAAMLCEGEVKEFLNGHTLLSFKEL
ncbi:MAG: ChbG/HpnK family deacetylase [Clostridium sp.]|nr:ChbG/HpnK family deacetylase [Clostridium sp.]